MSLREDIRKEILKEYNHTKKNGQYSWLCTDDYRHETKTIYGKYSSDRKGVMGPRNTFLKNGKEIMDYYNQYGGIKWQTRDKAGKKVHEGILVGDYTGFEPLDDLSMPDVGATEIYQWLDGTWDKI